MPHPNMLHLKSLLLDNASIAGQGFRKKAVALHRSIPVLAQALVERHGHKIRVVNSASVIGETDGSTIFLTNGVMPTSNKDIDTYLVYVALKLGLMHHEVGHVNESQFDLDIFDDAEVTDPRLRKYPPIVPKLLNIIEDIRMENAHIRRYKGARKYLDALSHASIVTGLNEAPDPSESITRIFTSYLLFNLRCHFRDEPHFIDFAEASRNLLVERLDQSLVTMIDAQLPRVLALRSSAEALEMACDIHFILQDQLQQLTQPSPPSSQGGQAGDSDEQDGGDGHDSGPSTTGNEGASGQADSSDLTDPDSQQSDATGSQIADALSDLLGSDGSDAKADLDDSVRQVIASMDKKLRAKSSYINDDVDMESIEAASATAPAALKLQTDEFDAALALSTVARLSNRLKQRLQANAMVTVGRSCTGTRIQQRSLVKAAMGDPRIFKTTNAGIDANAALFLLGDVSSSMSEDAGGTKRIDVSNQALFACAVALQRIPGIDVAVGAFPSRQIVLRFGERAMQHRGRFNLEAHDCTPLHDGLLMGTTALSRSNRARKLLIVCTDGEPDSVDLAIAAIEHAKLAGIEVYAIGVATDSVKNVFDNWSLISDVTELPTALISVLSNTFHVPLALAS